MNETPYCFMLLLADIIQRDAVGKWNILGAFDMLKPNEFPAEVTLGIFLGISDGRGQMPIKLQIVESDASFDDSASTPVGEVVGEIELPSPLDVVQATIAVPAKFDNPGTYHVELWANDVKIMTRRLVVQGPPKAEAK